MYSLSEFYGIQVKLAERLVNWSFADRVFFANSGTEANEAAIKFARKYQTEMTSRKGDTPWFKFGELRSASELVSFSSGFHGRTLGALALTSKAQYRTPFEPLIPGSKSYQISLSSQFSGPASCKLNMFLTAMSYS